MPNYPIQDGGEITIYQIEGRFPLTASDFYKGKWCTRAIGPRHFGERHAAYGESWDNVCPVYKEYGANGACWQKTGYEGFLDEELARKAIHLIGQHAPMDLYVDRWRLIERNIKVRVNVLVDANARKERTA